MLIQKPKGTYDLLPDKAFQRTFLESKIREIFSDFNYSEIRTPAFEKTELFKRGIGEETDIVSKEMYSFNEGEFTLKPEMTAPVIRAYLENSLYNESPLKKLFYISNMFRRERPQAGRYREFSQFGAEAIGSSEYTIDAEMILLADTILKKLGITDCTLRINTIGTVKEREKYLNEFTSYVGKYINDLSEDSRRRLEKNPLRILDTKNKKELEILEDSPVLYDFLSEQTKDNFENILSVIETMNINCVKDYRLVRGFDYYTSLVFEFVSGALGAQNSVLGGGRYDNLVEQLGGKPTPAIGFATGLERMSMILDSNSYNYPRQKRIKLYIATIGEESRKFSLKLSNQLRSAGIRCETDFLGRSVKAQMKEADKMNSEYVIIIGDDEIKSGTVKLKKMSDGSEMQIPEFKNLNLILSNENEAGQTGET